MKDRTNSWKTHVEAMIGGAWYSIPALGQCPASAPLGAGGCSWRLLERPLAFNASCVHGRLRAAVEAFGGGGFAARCSVAERRDAGSDAGSQDQRNTNATPTQHQRNTNSEARAHWG